MISDELLTNNPLVIVDVGARDGINPKWGKFTSAYRAILFEPDPTEYRRLESKGEKNLLVLNSALSDSVGSLNLNLCRSPGVSSVYYPDTDLLARFPDSERFEVIETIKVETDTLNNQLRANDIKEIDFMKIDVQGHELPILKGSVDYLDDAIGLEIEVEFAPLYKGQPLFSDVDSFVREFDFDLYDIKRYFWKREGSKNTGSQKGQLVFGDALYFKTPEKVLSMDGITAEKIIRTTAVYLVYGYLDLAQALIHQAAEKVLLTNEVQNKASKVLSECEKRDSFPNFRGKKRVQRFVERIYNILTPGGWKSGSDSFLGNP